jgi:hypothetical protein
MLVHFDFLVQKMQTQRSSEKNERVLFAMALCGIKNKK